jgi:mono/diheme cytochrome c family protein
MKKLIIVELVVLLVVMVVTVSFQTVPKKTTIQKQPAPITQATLNKGKLVYMQRCLVCHQADGGGVPHLNAPLDGATGVKSDDKARLIRIILKGMTDRVELDGEYYSNNMAPLPDLSDQQIADVLTYVRNSWSNKASAVSAAEVKTVRAKTK